MNFKRSTCKYCRADIVWAKLDSGKMCPFDFDAVDVGNREGTYILWQDLGAVDVRGQRARDFDCTLKPIFRDRYIPHPVTCPKRPE